MNLMDWYCAGFSLLFVALFEVLAIVYVYGYSRFAKDIQCMIGFKPNYYWIVCWHVLTPAFMLVSTCMVYTICNLISMGLPTYYHIGKVHRIVNEVLARFRKTKPFHSTSVRIQLCQAPHLDYCRCVWGLLN